ncbi:MAG TPA: ABC transporter ATP-binding protein [Chloroflexota bacterium]|nr:ABC transporter ATP-binding protein [Chloroflexota bacterium]
MRAPLAPSPLRADTARAGPALRIQGLGVTFGGVRVLDDLSFDVHAGQIVALIGPNGAGKTTVLNCINGFIRPQQGSIRAGGRELLSLPAHARARLGVGRTFQDLQLFGSMTVLDNVLVALHTRIRSGLIRDLLWLPARREERRASEHAHAVLARLGLQEHARRRADTLSLGQQKLLGVARCLALDARLLLLDEPAAGLTRYEATALGEVLRTLPDWHSGGHTAVLLVEHAMDLVMGVSDHVVVLDHGQKLADGSPEQVRRSPAVIAAYLGEESAHA